MLNTNGNKTLQWYVYIIIPPVILLYSITDIYVNLNPVGYNQKFII